MEEPCTVCYLKTKKQPSLNLEADKNKVAMRWSRREERTLARDVVTNLVEVLVRYHCLL